MAPSAPDRAGMLGTGPQITSLPRSSGRYQMGHLARRQKVLPSLVSHEGSASISLLSTSLSTWENPVNRTELEPVFPFPWKIPSSPRVGGRHPQAGAGQRGRAARSWWPASSPAALGTGEGGSAHKGAAVWEARGWHRAPRGHLRANPALSGGSARAAVMEGPWPRCAETAFNSYPPAGYPWTERCASWEGFQCSFSLRDGPRRRSGGRALAKDSVLTCRRGR